MKGQTVRLLDVYAIGPLMMYSGARARMHPALKASMIAFGAATIVYNGLNYLAVEREKRRRRESERLRSVVV